jgi:hypothetical protein
MSDDNNDIIDIEENEENEDFESQFNIEEQSNDIEKFGKKKEVVQVKQKFDSAEYMMKKQKEK